MRTDVNPPAFVHCRWCGKRLVRQALRAHQQLRCPVRALRQRMHQLADELGLWKRSPGSEREKLPAWRAAEPGFERLIEDGGRRRVAVREGWA